MINAPGNVLYAFVRTVHPCALVGGITPSLLEQKLFFQAGGIPFLPPLPGFYLCRKPSRESFRVIDAPELAARLAPIKLSPAAPFLFH